MYEVRYGSIIVYLSDDGRYMLRGDLVDLETGHNVTETARSHARAPRSGRCARRVEHGRVRAAMTPVKHTVTVFTDVDCGYCASGCNRQMADYNRLGIKHPVHGIPSGRSRLATTYDKMVSVWCADPTAYRDDRCEGRARRRDGPMRQPGSATHYRGRQGDRCDRGHRRSSWSPAR